MSRILIVGLFAIVVDAPIKAQEKSRGSGFGGGFKSSTPSRNVFPPLAPLPPMPAMSPPPAGLSGGFVRTGPHYFPHQQHPGYPFFGMWQGFGGWAPLYGYPVEVPVPIEVPVPVYVPVVPAEPPVELSGEAPATLVLEFPAPAEVWLNGKRVKGDAQSEWTLTTPAVTVGTEHPFSVRARWTTNGRTFEYEKTVAVAGGSRSRSLVLSGREIK